MIAELAAQHITTMTGVEDLEILETGVTLSTGEGKRLVIDADTIVIAAGVQSRDHLVGGFRGKVKEIHVVGDCVSPRDILSAIREGAAAGHSI